jgi:hypothetical protein
MRCNICDSVIDEPKWNAELKGWEICDSCMVVVHDTLASYQDRPYVEEDELPDGPLALTYELGDEPDLE